MSVEINTNDRVLGRHLDINNLLGVVTNVNTEGRKRIYHVAFDEGFTRSCLRSHIWLSDAPLAGVNLPPPEVDVAEAEANAPVVAYDHTDNPEQLFLDYRFDSDEDDEDFSLGSDGSEETSER